MVDALHETLIAKLATRAALDDLDRAAIRALPCTLRTFEAQSYLAREGERLTRCTFLLSGFAYKQKLTANGGRQIVGLSIPTDFLDLQHLFLAESDHNIQALTRLKTAEFAADDLRLLALERPTVAWALWIEILVEASITREAVLNVGRRDGPARLAHLLCEFETRMDAAGLSHRGYDLPMTQEQIGDATGLTAVHVNRTFKLLEREGLIVRSKRRLRIADWEGLVDRADFNTRYLHLDQLRSPEPDPPSAPAPR